MFSECYLSNYLYLFDIILLYMFKKYIYRAIDKLANRSKRENPARS